MSIIPNPSDEQESIIKQLETKNVVVNSVVGAGKTSTVLQIAKLYPTKKILLLTYNKRLKLDTRVRAENLNNIEVHSFHSFCVCYSQFNNCHTDYGLLHLLSNKELLNSKSRFRDYSYDLIVVDEAQDMNPLYYEIVCKICSENLMNNDNWVKYCIIGDIYQSIYGYNLSDERYILNAQKLFRFNNLPWSKKKLTETFRLTKPITDFINKCLLGEERIISNKMTTSLGTEAPKPRYIMCNQFSYQRTYQEIDFYIKKGYSHEDFFILAPSVRNDKTPIRKLANKLASEGHPIYCPISDEEKLDSEITQGKLVFCTYHQVKGLERKVVIVYNFDDSYFKFYNRNSDPENCPNEIYVAVTRSLECLTLIHHTGANYLEFVNLPKLRLYTTMEKQPLDLSQKKISDKYKTPTTGVTEVLRHLPVSVIEKALESITIETVHKKEHLIEIPTKTMQPTKNSKGTIYENVSEITGIAIPSYYELVKNGSMTINSLMNQDSMKKLSVMYDLQSRFYKSDEMIKNTYDGYMFRERDTDIHPHIDPEELLYLSNKWNALSSGFNFKMKQIKRYTWITKDVLEQCVSRLEQHISKDAQFEIYYSIDYESSDVSPRILQGYVDCIDPQENYINVWEFKCVHEIDRSAFLQLALYSYLISHDDPDTDYRYFLFNILNHEIYQIHISKEYLKEIVDFLFYSKYAVNDFPTDIKFIRENIKIKNKYFETESQKKITEFFR